MGNRNCCYYTDEKALEQKYEMSTRRTLHRPTHAKLRSSRPPTSMHNEACLSLSDDRILQITEYYVQDDLDEALLCPIPDPDPDKFVVVINSQEDFHKVEVTIGEGARGMKELGYVEVPGDVKYIDAVYSKAQKAVYVQMKVRDCMRFIRLNFVEHSWEEVFVNSQSHTIDEPGTLFMTESGNVMLDQTDRGVDVYNVSRHSVTLRCTISLLPRSIIPFGENMVIIEVVQKSGSVLNIIDFNSAGPDPKTLRVVSAFNLKHGWFKCTEKLVTGHGRVSSTLSASTSLGYVCYSQINSKTEKLDVTLLRVTDYCRLERVEQMSGFPSDGHGKVKNFSMRVFPCQSDDYLVIFFTIESKDGSHSLKSLCFDGKRLRRFKDDIEGLFSTRCRSGLRLLDDSLICYSNGCLKHLCLI